MGKFDLNMLRVDVKRGFKDIRIREDVRGLSRVTKNLEVSGFFRPGQSILIFKLQWNLDITKGGGTGKICSLKRVFVISRFFFICFTVTGVKKIVRYSKDFVL